jgi:hypothetical protein
LSAATSVVAYSPASLARTVTLVANRHHNPEEFLSGNIGDSTLSYFPAGTTTFSVP